MNNEDPIYRSAQKFQKAGQLTQAMRLYEELLTQSPDHIDALRSLASVYATMNDMPKTILYLGRASALQPTDPTLHNNLANAYKKSNDFDQALKHYQQALNINPNYAEAHSNIAGLYSLQNNLQKALHHYRMAVHARPDFIAAHYNLGLLLLKNNYLDAAKTQFHNVLSLYPDHVEATFYLATLYLAENALEKAEHLFQTVLNIHSEHSDALSNMGIIALKRNQGQLAIDYFTKALSFDNNNLDARNNLAATFIHHDLFENALMHYDVLLQDNPHHIEYLYNTGVAQMALGRLPEATTLFETILSLDQAHFATLHNLAAIQIRLGAREDAIRLLERAMAVNPNDEVCQFMLNALTGHEKTPKACPDYVSNLFNNYASYYEQHLKGPLNYQIPYQIGRALHQLKLAHVKQALDLGCGTGLCGIVMREMSDQLTGVDIAAKMLTQATQKGIYDHLIESEIIHFLTSSQEQYDLIVAGDVIPYLGALECLFEAIHPRLFDHNSLFILTHEIGETDPWELQESARFGHHPNYIKTLCDQYHFEIILEETVLARQQNEKPLFVKLYILTQGFGDSV